MRVAAAQYTKALEPKEYFLAVVGATPHYDVWPDRGRCGVEEFGFLDSTILCILTNETKPRALTVV